MNADLLLFQKIAERLEFLTTKDEYGSCRSRGISNYDELSDDLNDTGIVPSRGYWTKNSLALFFYRVHKRYSVEELFSLCQIEFIGRHSWEYQSCTKHEDICDRRNSRHFYSPDAPQAKHASENKSRNEIDLWKRCEISEVSYQDKKMIKILNSMKSKRRFVN